MRNDTHQKKWLEFQKAGERIEEMKVSGRKLFRSKQYSEMKEKEKSWRKKYRVLWNNDWKRHECYVNSWREKIECKFEAKLLADDWERYSV